MHTAEKQSWVDSGTSVPWQQHFAHFQNSLEVTWTPWAATLRFECWPIELERWEVMLKRSRLIVRCKGRRERRMKCRLPLHSLLLLHLCHWVKWDWTEELMSLLPPPKARRHDREWLLWKNVPPRLKEKSHIWGVSSQPGRSRKCVTWQMWQPISLRLLSLEWRKTRQVNCKRLGRLLPPGEGGASRCSNSSIARSKFIPLKWPFP